MIALLVKSVICMSYTAAHIYLCTYRDTYMHTHAHMYVHTCTRIHIHIHINTRHTWIAKAILHVPNVMPNQRVVNRAKRQYRACRIDDPFDFVGHVCLETKDGFEKEPSDAGVFALHVEDHVCPQS
jgi:hypothetical protein